MAPSPTRRLVLALLPAFLMGLPIRGALHADTGAPGDGYLSQRVEGLVYPSDDRFEESDRGWVLRREVSLLEGYLWRHSLRRLSVEVRVNIVHRRLGRGEFRNYGDRFGFLLDRSPEVEADLRALSVTASPLLLLYDPPPDCPNRIAGRTFFEGSHSSIPLSPRYFLQSGFDRPLHLVMAHEYIHQIDLAFSRLHHPSGFLDPDGAGQDGYPPCIDAGGGDRSLRTVLQFDRSCGPVDWGLLSPAYGIWISR